MIGVRATDDFPLITAHSGAEGSIPNSKEFIVAAARGGADFTELDLRLTADGVPVFWHPDSLSATTGEKYSIAGSTYISLMEAANRNGIETERGILREFPPAVEMIRLVRELGQGIHLDLKDRNALKGIYRILDTLDMTGRTILSGIHEPEAREIRREYSQLPTLLNLDYELERIDDRDAVRRITKCTIEKALSMGILALNMEYTHINQELVDLAHSRNMKISVWTLKPEHDFAAYIRMKVDYITTDHVRQLRTLADKMTRFQN